MEKIYEILKRNEGKEICLSANYTEVCGEVLGFEEGWVVLKLDKKGKKIQTIKVDTIYSVMEQND